MDVGGLCHSDSRKVLGVLKSIISSDIRFIHLFDMCYSVWACKEGGLGISERIDCTRRVLMKAKVCKVYGSYARYA